MSLKQSDRNLLKKKNPKTQKHPHQVSKGVFPAFHMGEHVMLQAGDTAEFTVVVGWDTFTGAAVLPHILKTCRCSGHYLCIIQHNIEGKKMSSNFVTGKTL